MFALTISHQYVDYLSEDKYIFCAIVEAVEEKEIFVINNLLSLMIGIVLHPLHSQCILFFE